MRWQLDNSVGLNIVIETAGSDLERLEQIDRWIAQRPELSSRPTGPIGTSAIDLLLLFVTDTRPKTLKEAGLTLRRNPGVRYIVASCDRGLEVAPGWPFRSTLTAPSVAAALLPIDLLWRTESPIGLDAADVFSMFEGRTAVAYPISQAAYLFDNAVIPHGVAAVLKAGTALKNVGNLQAELMSRWSNADIICAIGSVTEGFITLLHDHTAEGIEHGLRRCSG